MGQFCINTCVILLLVILKCASSLIQESEDCCPFPRNVPTITLPQKCYKTGEIIDPDQFVCPTNHKLIPRNGMICLREGWSKTAKCIPDDQIIDTFDDPFTDVICGLRPMELNSRKKRGITKRKRKLRVVGGTTRPKGLYPWQVGVRVQDVRRGGDKHWCGGTILSEYWILSAAQCFKHLTKDNVSVRVGDHDNKRQDDFEQEFELEHLITHSQYDDITVDYSIALLKIKPKNGRGIMFGYHVQPACLPDQTSSYVDGQQCHVSGWGRTKYGLPDMLQSATVNIINDETCQRLYMFGRTTRITPRMICAGYLEGGTDACEGDSGGPLVCDINGLYTLMGVTSWGIGCGLQNKPGVYARVTEFVPWIKAKLKEYSGVRCNPIGELHGGDVHYENDTMEVGTSAFFECDDDFSIYPDVDNSLCLANRTWSPEPPKCYKKARAKCPDNSDCHGSFLLHHNQTKTIRCDKDYELFDVDNKVFLDKKEIQITNINGTLKPGVPRCVEKRCFSTTLTHAVIKYANGSHADLEVLSGGERLDVSCEDRYELDSDRYRRLHKLSESVCCSKGKFYKNCKEDKEATQCIEKSCPFEGYPSNMRTKRQRAGEFSMFLADDEYIEHGETIEYSCQNDEYELYVKETDKYLTEFSETCQYGNFSRPKQEFPLCQERGCEFPISERDINLCYLVSNSSSVCSNDTFKTASRSSFNLTCKEGYELYDNTNRTYTGEEWATLTCVKGKATPEYLCKPKRCMLPSMPSNATTRMSRTIPSINSSHVESGKSVELSCKGEDFELFVESTNTYLPNFQSTCFEGNFDKTLTEFPYCTEKRCVFKHIPGVKYYTHDKENPESNGVFTVESRSRINVTCNPGFKLFSKRTTKDSREETATVGCIKGKLEEDITCLPEKLWQMIYTQVKVLFYRYEETMSKFGCRFSLLSSQPCADSCFVPEIQHGWMKLKFSYYAIRRDVNHETKVQVKCDEDYQLVGSEELQCINGEWNNELPVCWYKPCEFDFVQGQLVLDKNNNFISPSGQPMKFPNGTQLNFMCLTGYSLNIVTAGVAQEERNFTNVTTVCQSGSWMPLYTCFPNDQIIDTFDDPFTDVICGLRPMEPYSRKKRGITKRKRDLRVIGGTTRPKGLYPWQVGVRVPNGKPGGKHWCGGTILSEYWILSAAHCFTNLTKDNVSVRVGDHNNTRQDDFEQEFDLEHLITHSQYNNKTYDYDIALLKIKPNNGKGIMFGYHVQPACLPDQASSYVDGQECHVSGWGSTTYSIISLPDMLQSATVNIIKDETCQRLHMLNGTTRITPRMVCAGYLEGGIDTCGGDSGGPLVCDINGLYTLMGVTSWGKGCGLRNKPGVYARVTEFVPWIKAKLKDYSVLCDAECTKNGGTCIAPGKCGNCPPRAYGNNCEHRECTLPADGPKVKKEKSSYQLGDKILSSEISCSEGYIATPEIGITCLEGGKWSDTPKCIKDQTGCNLPSGDTFLYKSTDGDSINPGSFIRNGRKVQVSCQYIEPDYDHYDYSVDMAEKETDTVQCLNGQLGNISLKCTTVPETCTALANGLVIRRFMNEYEVSCDEGYALNLILPDMPYCTCRDDKLVCQFGGQTPECKPVPCKIPETFDSGLTIHVQREEGDIFLSGGVQVDVGENVILSCTHTDVQYFEPNNRRFKCENGKWLEAETDQTWDFGNKGEFPKCRNTTCEPFCKNGGECIRDDTCKCPHHTSGKRCENDLLDDCFKYIPRFFPFANGRERLDSFFIGKGTSMNDTTCRLECLNWTNKICKSVLHTTVRNEHNIVQYYTCWGFKEHKQYRQFYINYDMAYGRYYVRTCL